MASRFFLLSLLCVGFLWSDSSHAHGTEADFVYVSGMPAIQGTLIRSATGNDRRGGLEIRLEIFDLDLGKAVHLETRATYMRCAGSAVIGATSKPHIMAMKIKPLKPKTFAVATLNDIYTEAYVREAQGRIRLYRNLNGRQMQVLTDRYKLSCPGI